MVLASITCYPPPPMSNDPTDTGVEPFWTKFDNPEPESCLHLVAAWTLTGPDRAGHAAPINERGWWGRGEPAQGDKTKIRFQAQRPRDITTVPPFEETYISRRQLEFEPESEHETRVSNIGRRPLLHNGQVVNQCTVHAGDMLMLQDALLFLVEMRPSYIPLPSAPEGPKFPYGTADDCGLVGESFPAWQLRDHLSAAANADAHVLLLGESGVGKEIAAKTIHARSARHTGPMVARNAATLPAGLIDAELFGNIKNYPNPGTPERPGLIGAAAGGHLFLDEIGELSEVHQAHLLRVMDSGGEYQRLGETEPRVSDFRLIAATNRDPGELKHDFLARFSNVIRISGLNDRRSDIPLLARELLGRMAAQTPEVADRFFEGGQARRVRIEPRLVELLLRHQYTYHTRELERVLRVAVETSREGYLAVTEPVLSELGVIAPSQSVESGELDARAVQQALTEQHYNIGKTAERLGISRHVLYRLMKKFDLSTP